MWGQHIHFCRSGKLRRSPSAVSGPSTTPISVPIAEVSWHVMSILVRMGNKVSPIEENWGETQGSYWRRWPHSCEPLDSATTLPRRPAKLAAVSAWRANRKRISPVSGEFRRHSGETQFLALYRVQQGRVGSLGETFFELGDCTAQERELRRRAARMPLRLACEGWLPFTENLLSPNALLTNPVSPSSTKLQAHRRTRESTEPQHVCRRDADDVAAPDADRQGHGSICNCRMARPDPT
jgi:hypothetical protein